MSSYKTGWLFRTGSPFLFQPYYANDNQLRQAEVILVVSTQFGKVGTSLPGSLNHSAYLFYLLKPEQYKRKWKTGKPVLFTTFNITNVSYSLLKATLKIKSQEAFVLHTHRKMRRRVRVRINYYHCYCYCCYHYYHYYYH